MKLRLDLVLCFSTLFRLFFNATAPSRHRDHHILSYCYHCYYSSLFFLSRSRHADTHSMAFQLPAGEHIEDVGPRSAEPLKLNTTPPPPSRITRPRATTTPRRIILSLLSPPVDDGPLAAVPLPGSDVMASGPPQR